MHRYQKSFIIILWLINLNTLWFVTPLSQNLSHLGNALHMRWYLILWAASADRKSTRLNSSNSGESRMPSSA